MNCTKLLLLFVAALFLVGSNVNADVGLRLYDLVVDGSGLPDTIWEVDVATPTLLNSVTLDSFNAIAGFEFGGGVFYAASTNVNTELFVWDPNTGSLLDTIIMQFPVGGNVITSLEFVSGTLYGGFATEGGGRGLIPSSLVTINTSTGAVDLVGAMGFNSPTGGLAYDGSTLYTVNSGFSGSATLYTVSLTDGMATAVGAITGVTGAPITLTGLEFGNDGVLYGLGRSSNENQLFSINPATGEATQLGTLPVVNKSTSLTTVPEPGTVALLGVYVFGVAVASRRSQKGVRNAQ